MKKLLFLISISLNLSADSVYKSQVGQDTYIHETFFKNKHKGVFVDIGAHDGITFSNSYFFEKELGWSGLCIEPRAHLYEKLKGCRSCACVRACISDQTGIVPFLNIEGVDEMLSGMVSTYDQRQLDIVMNDIRYHGGQIKTIQVPCVLLQELLEVHSMNHVDFLSVDTEGGELEILKTIDFENITIDVITVENNYAEAPIREFLCSKGYLLVNRIHPDDIFVRKGFAF